MSWQWCTKAPAMRSTTMLSVLWFPVPVGKCRSSMSCKAEFQLNCWLPLYLLRSAPLSDEDCTALYHEVGLHRALPVPKTERPKVLWLFGPPAAGKSTLAAEHSPTIFGINGSAVSVDGEEIRGQHKGFRRVAQHGLENHLLHKDAWGILKATGHVEGLKRTILRKAIQNRQNITMPDCALKPARVMEMLKEFQDADYEMHAICLWAPAHEAERRGRLRSVQTGKAYSPKFHRPSSDGTIEIARYWEEQMRQGNKHFNGIKYYDATSLPACPVVLNEVENLMENSELVRRVSLGRDDARRLSFKKPGLHAAEAAILHKGPSQTWKDYVLQICWLAPGFLRYVGACFTAKTWVILGMYQGISFHNSGLLGLVRLG
ncbi:unnamed protein product [Effrenium voratum]|nr:unnamed protein product [Effrenium voratum]